MSDDKRDAERYRWLRKARHSFHDERSGESSIAWNYFELAEGSDEQLDAAIDAAIAAQSEPPPCR